MRYRSVAWLASQLDQKSSWLLKFPVGGQKDRQRLHGARDKILSGHFGGRQTIRMASRTKFLSRAGEMNCPSE